MATVADLESLGYTVGEAAPGVFFVAGFGLATYIDAGDQVQIDSLADPVLHAQRIAPPPPPPVPPPKPPAAADTVLGALNKLDPAKATVADVVNAVKAALGVAGATPV